MSCSSMMRLKVINQLWNCVSVTSLHATSMDLVSFDWSDELCARKREIQCFSIDLNNESSSSRHDFLISEVKLCKNWWWTELAMHESHSIHLTSACSSSVKRACWSTLTSRRIRSSFNRWSRVLLDVSVAKYACLILE